MSRRPHAACAWTHQFRNNGPLRHMRSPLHTGRMVEVRIGSSTTWQVAMIKKIMMDATDRLNLLEVRRKEVVFEGGARCPVNVCVASWVVSALFEEKCHSTLLLPPVYETGQRKSIPHKKSELVSCGGYMGRCRVWWREARGHRLPSRSNSPTLSHAQRSPILTALGRTLSLCPIHAYFH